MTNHVEIPIVGVVEDGKVTYFCPRCKKPRRLGRKPVTTACNDCLPEIEFELKKKK